MTLIAFVDLVACMLRPVSNFLLLIPLPAVKY